MLTARVRTTRPIQPLSKAQLEKNNPLIQFQELAPGDPLESSSDKTLTLGQVLTSVQDCYPAIQIAFGEIESADGKVTESLGNFDRRITAQSISQPLGFYQNFRNGVGIHRPLFGGGEVYGTYRIGDGSFEPWYGERETNEAGEFKAGFSIPLIKDRNIDQRRANLFTAQLQRQQVASDIESRLLFFQRFATQAYWDWVASGQGRSNSKTSFGIGRKTSSANQESN